MTDQEFKQLQEDIQMLMKDLNELQDRHHKETGRYFINGQPIMDSSKERLWGLPKPKKMCQTTGCTKEAMPGYAHCVKRRCREGVKPLPKNSPWGK